VPHVLAGGEVGLHILTSGVAAFLEVSRPRRRTRSSKFPGGSARLTGIISSADARMSGECVAETTWTAACGIILSITTSRLFKICRCHRGCR
jgi:hypothetical protein